MKKEMKSKIFLKLNKQTIANLNKKELNSLKGGTQLMGVTAGPEKSSMCPPPPVSEDCNNTNLGTSLDRTQKVNLLI